MKTFLKTQLQHELIGQAILELIIQKLPITEDTLLKQLRNAKANTTSQEHLVILQELITEFSSRAKKRSPAARSTMEYSVTAKGDQERSNAELLILTQDNKHKLH